jgi:hypothetical protein
MIHEMQALVDRYWVWLKDQTSLRQVEGDWIEISTPFLDRHNDGLQIYARHEGEDLLMTDDGYILRDLEATGCKLDNPRRQALIQLTLRGFGVQLADDRLEIRARPENFAQKKHNLIQAMIGVNDLFYLSKSSVRGLFLEDVQDWMDKKDIRFSPNVQLLGKSGLPHSFHFLINKSRQQPERIIRAINTPDRANAESFAFAWIDTREARAPEARAFAVVNDQDHSVSGNFIETLRSYEIEPLLWGQRDSFAGLLAS